MAMDRGLYSAAAKEKISSSKVFLVGAGGVGCEILKNLVLSGFKNIDVVDLDTIEVSNLNRQFLFRREHVQKSKAQVARDSVLRFVPAANITAHHDSIINAKYGVNFIKQFDVVLNALDNRAARNQVNRVCLAAGVPLVESGTSGYFGQVEIIVKGQTTCYECLPKVVPKSFAGCTIRNTPTEYIHTVVWAKNLFNQLFGDLDDSGDQEVSPDIPEEMSKSEGGGGDEADTKNANGEESMDSSKTPMKEWASSVNYDPIKIFDKVFCSDIMYLLKMKDLWTTRKPPEPMKFPQNYAPDEAYLTSDDEQWTTLGCCEGFIRSVEELYRRYKEENRPLTWDKEDRMCMVFVTATANLRAQIFNIGAKSYFQTKSMAGNIVPAIATSNAIIAGLAVLHAIKILQKKIEACKIVYLRKLPNPRGQLIVPEKFLAKPNPTCVVCSPKPTITICCDLESMTVKEFLNQILKKYLDIQSPDVMNNSFVIISSEEGETDHLLPKTLKEVGVADGTILDVDEFIQNYELKIIMQQRDKPTDPLEPLFIVQGKVEPIPTPSTSKQSNGASESAAKRRREEEEPVAATSSDHDEVIFVAEEERKRKLDDESGIPVKKRKPVEEECEEIDNDGLVTIQLS